MRGHSSAAHPVCLAVLHVQLLLALAEVVPPDWPTAKVRQLQPPACLLPVRPRSPASAPPVSQEPIHPPMHGTVPTCLLPQVTQEVVLPLTQAFKCRLVDTPGLVPPAMVGSPTYFASHW